jgi:8-oxo-dGTP pyrophosphatase MutT (NUDIX family)
MPETRLAWQPDAWQAGSESGVAPTRPAATVILLRASASGSPEVFMVRRTARSAFAADAFVFPGGTVEAADGSELAMSSAPGLIPEAAHARLVERGGDPPPDPQVSFALHVAAVRELFEEAGVLLAVPRPGVTGGKPERTLIERLATARTDVLAGRRSLAELAHHERLDLAPEQLVYFSHWITPEVSHRRFDTRFFAALMPAGQTALHCNLETTEGEWLEPAVALDRAAGGELKIVFATSAHLERLASFSSVDELIRFARAKRIRTVRPTLARGGGGWSVGPVHQPW